MRRRHRQPEPENHERWLVSYADFITLLFAFFVMMYAHSKTDQARAAQISQAFQEAMAQGSVTGTLARLVGMAPSTASAAAIPPKPAPEPGKTVDLLPSLNLLRDKLKDEIDKGRLDVTLEGRGLVISLREAAFFPSGNDAIAEPTIPTLATIARELQQTPNPIRLEGHTDSVPIQNARFRSNWDLSAARGIAMLNLFTQRFGLPPERLAIAGFADTAPLADNATEAGRARNRRVDIVVLNEVASRAEPAQSAASASPQPPPQSPAQPLPAQPPPATQPHTPEPRPDRK